MTPVRTLRTGVFCILLSELKNGGYECVCRSLVNRFISFRRSLSMLDESQLQKF